MKGRDREQLRQVFNRAIHGGVAGRDVLNIDLGNCAEYEAQHLFEQCTRIRCTRRGREQLVHLAEHCDFGFPELRTAIVGGALTWDRSTRRWRAAAAWPSYLAAAVFGALGALLAFAVCAAVWAHLSASNSFLATLLVASVLILGFALLQIQFVVPHRVARRAVKALEGAHQDASQCSPA